MSSLELKIPPLALLAIFIVDMLILRWLFPWPEFSFSTQQSISIFLLSGGILFPLLGFMAFQQASTTVHPQRPDETKVLVRSGVYVYTRKPHVSWFFDDSFSLGDLFRESLECLHGAGLCLVHESVSDHP